MVEECKTIFIYEDHEGREYMRKCARQKHENDNHKIKRIGMSANAYYTKPEGYKRKTTMIKELQKRAEYHQDRADSYKAKIDAIKRNNLRSCWNIVKKRFS